ncbi:hypothetical protein QCD85_03865 [Paenibacillus sp. PsM32]|uniref:hypothetical protein n=1 Tax=Paenibacillus sp. PsM32 TaxID=3030536 RepID=UPI00263ACEF3|nr:hypothetical protein [Paenibacillus sp. PsM32]MDN4617215.1 hypothetical protein [Paenibacillus sp. PsM32]
MSSVKEQPVGKCCVCSQGWIIVVKEISSQKYFVYCDECEIEWDHPEDFLTNQKGTRFKYGFIIEASKQEVVDIGWYKYIDQTMLQ